MMTHLQPAQGFSEREITLPDYTAHPIRRRNNIVPSWAWRARCRKVRKGSRIFAVSAPFARAYSVAAGEVLILRDGQPVDLVEAGELLDSRFWQGASAVAYTDCILSSPRVGV